MTGRIGILGGTFDPIHMGHLFLAETARDVMKLDKVLLMPSPDPYYRVDKKVSPSEHRVNMVKLAVEDNPGLEFSDFELKMGSPAYTAYTLEAFARENPGCEIYFILGGDSLFSIERWVEPEKIFSTAKILSAKRENESKGASGSCSPSNLDLKEDSLEDEFEAMADHLRQKFNAEIINIHVPVIEISSSRIISKLKAGESVKYYLPDKVIDYIKENKLYELR